jgi:hypothetical protein
MMKKAKRSSGCALEGKTVCMLIDYQYEDMEVQYPKVRLEEEGAQVGRERLFVLN